MNMTKKREIHGLFHLQVWFNLELKLSLEFTLEFSKLLPAEVLFFLGIWKTEK